MSAWGNRNLEHGDATASGNKLLSRPVVTPTVGDPCGIPWVPLITPCQCFAPRSARKSFFPEKRVPGIQRRGPCGPPQVWNKRDHFAANMDGHDKLGDRALGARLFYRSLRPCAGAPAPFLLDVFLFDALTFNIDNAQPE